MGELKENDPFLRNEDRAWLGSLGSLKTRPSRIRVTDSEAGGSSAAPSTSLCSIYGQLLKMLALAKTFTVAVTFKTNQGHREHVFYISKLIFLSFCQPREVGREDHTNSYYTEVNFPKCLKGRATFLNMARRATKNGRLSCSTPPLSESGRL